MALLSICQDCQGSILGPHVSPTAISSRMMPNIFPKSPKRCCLQVGPAHKSSALPKLLGPPSLDLHKNHKGTMRSHPLRGFLMETHGCLPQSMDSFWRCATPPFEVNKVLKGRLFHLPGHQTHRRISYNVFATILGMSNQSSESSETCWDPQSQAQPMVFQHNSQLAAPYST